MKITPDNIRHSIISALKSLTTSENLLLYLRCLPTKLIYQPQQHDTTHPIDISSSALNDTVEVSKSPKTNLLFTAICLEQIEALWMHDICLLLDDDDIFFTLFDADDKKRFIQLTDCLNQALKKLKKFFLPHKAVTESEMQQFLTNDDTWQTAFLLAITSYKQWSQ